MTHTNDELGDGLHDPGPARRSAFLGPLLRNELPMPPKDGVGSDDRCDFRQCPPADGSTPHGQSASLIVGQPESFATELLLQDTILFSEVLDDRVLLSGDPARHSGDEDLPRLDDSGHRPIMTTSLGNRQLPVSSETA
jgi:hypothetical protein